MKKAIMLGFTLILFLVYLPMNTFAQAHDEEVPPPPPPASDGEAGYRQEVPPPPPPKDVGDEEMIQEPKKMQEKEIEMAPPPPPPPEVEVLYLTEEEESAALEYVEEKDPDYAKMLRRIRETDRNQFKRKISLVHREHRALRRIKERDPERYKRLLREKELEIKSHKLVEEYNTTGSDSERQKLRKDLVELLNKLFDLRQVNREGEIKQLEKKLEELKEFSKTRIEKKDEIVQRRLAELLREDRELDW